MTTLSSPFHRLLIDSVKEGTFKPELYCHESNIYQMFTTPEAPKWYQCAGQIGITSFAYQWMNHTDEKVASEREALASALEETPDYPTPELLFGRLLELELAMDRQAWDSAMPAVNRDTSNSTRLYSNPEVPTPSAAKSPAGRSDGEPLSDEARTQYIKLVKMLQKAEKQDDLSPEKFRQILGALGNFGQGAFTVQVTSGEGSLDYVASEGSNGSVEPA